jgi:Tol biopolymer transport system component
MAKRVVYAAMDGGGTAIWRRELETGRVVRLVPRLTGTISNLAFTDHGATIAFVNFPPKQPSNRELYTVPVSGGNPQQVLGTFSGPVGLSTDGRQAAFYESNVPAGTSELWIENTESGARRMLTAYKFPEHFETICKPTWSPDGKLLAYAAEQNDKDGYLVRLYVIDTKTGSRHAVASPRWQWSQSVAWMGDKSALAAVGQERDSSFQQVWYLPYLNAKGPPRRIGNDLDDYIGASLTARSSELVSVQQQTLSNIYVLKAGSPSPVQVTLGSGRYFDLSWMSDGQILYASDATGSADLWLMHRDGTGERQITFGTGAITRRSRHPMPSRLPFIPIAAETGKSGEPARTAVVRSNLAPARETETGRNLPPMVNSSCSTGPAKRVVSIYGKSRQPAALPSKSLSL